MSLSAKNLRLGITILGAAGLAGLGALFVINPQSAYAISGHSPDALETVMGGRYFGLALALGAFAVIQDARGAAVILAVGVFLALFDAWAVSGIANASMLPHIGAACGALILALWHYSAYRKGH